MCTYGNLFISIKWTFYFTLGNLSLKYQSQLTSIYLVALVKSSFISAYGMDEVLRPFVNDVKKLVKTVLTIHSNVFSRFFIEKRSWVCNQWTTKAFLTVISADNLGSLLLGGFKESYSAYRMCRHCLCTKDGSTTQVRMNISTNFYYTRTI